MVRSRERLGGLLRFYHREARPVQKHKRTHDWRARPFRSSSPRGEPQIWGVSEAMSAIRVLRTCREKHRPATRCHVPGRRPGARPGPHLDQNVLGQLRRGNLSLDSEPLGCFFSRRPHSPVSAYSLIWRNLALENRD